MSHKRSHLSAGACLAVALTLPLTWRLAPSVHAQTASGQSDPQTMLVVLKNQPARQIVDGLESRPGTPRKLAEQDVGRLRTQAGVPEQMKLDAGRRLVTQLLAERREATAQIKAATGPEQEMLAGRLTGLGATGIRRYTALNMLQARIPDAMLDVVKQDPAVAEVIPAGGHQGLLDQIEQGLSNPQELSVTVLDKADSSDPAEQAFAKLIDRIIYDRNALVAAASDAAAFNTVPAVYSLARLARSGALPVAHQGIKALQLNGGDSGVFGNSVSAGKSFRLYTGRSEGPLRSTLAWDRRFGEGLDPYLPNLDLFLYDKGQGAQLASSESKDKNVEQLGFSDAGELVVKVKLQPSDDGNTAEESYALAVSVRAFTPAEGPKLRVKCAADCTVGNDGDLPAFDVTARADGVEYKLGAIAAWSSAKFTPGQKVSAASVTSDSFGEVFTANTSTGDPCNGQWTISPQPLRLNPDPASSGMMARVTVTPPAGCVNWNIDVPSDPSGAKLIFTGEICTGCAPGAVSILVRDAYVYLTGSGDHHWVVDIFPKNSLVIAPTYASFDVVETSRIPAVKLVTPKGGEQYTRGKDTMAVSWTYDPGLPPFSPIAGTIELMSGSGSVAGYIDYYVPLVPPGGTVNWPVPAALAPGSYSVRIRSTNLPLVTAQDQSPPVTVRADTLPPAFITNVTATDGVAGFDNKQMQIGWVVSGAITGTGPKDCKIEVLRGTTVVKTIDGIPLNPPGYSWLIPVNTPAAMNYKVRVTPTDLSIKGDESRPNVEVKVWHDPFDQAIKDFMKDPTNFMKDPTDVKDKPQPIPGGQLGILHDGKLAYAQGYGGPTAASLFRIASVTKPFTAAAIYKLIEEDKKLALTDKVFSDGPNHGILQGWEHEKDRRIYDITVEDLLTHRGGWDTTDLADQYNAAHRGADFKGGFDPMFQSILVSADLAKPKILPPFTPEQQAKIPGPWPTLNIVDYVLDNFSLKCVPGQAQRYSNVGYAVLGLVIEKVSHKSYDQYLTDMFNIIGAKNTFFGVTPAPDRWGVCTPNPYKNEVSYHAADTEKEWCVFKPHISGPWPDGGFDLAAWVAAGGLVANTSDLLRFEAAMTGTSNVVSKYLTARLDAADKFPFYDPKVPTQSNILFPAFSTDKGDTSKLWLGDFPGTLALLIQHDVPSKPDAKPPLLAQHTGFAVLFNGRPIQAPPPPPGACTDVPQTSDRYKMVTRLKRQLTDLADHLKEWPATDLFIAK